jgi:hypothetical protein
MTLPSPSADWYNAPSGPAAMPANADEQPAAVQLRTDEANCQHVGTGMLLRHIQSPPPGATVEGWTALCVGEATEVARVAADVTVSVAPTVIGTSVFGGRGCAPCPDPARAVPFPRKPSATRALAPAVVVNSFVDFLMVIVSEMVRRTRDHCFCPSNRVTIRADRL